MSLISIIFKSVLGEGCFILNLFLRLCVCGSAKAWLLLQVLKCPFWSYWCHWFHAWSMQNWCCMVFSTGCWEHRPVRLLVQLHWQLSRPPSSDADLPAWGVLVQISDWGVLAPLTCEGTATNHLATSMGSWPCFLSPLLGVKVTPCCTDSSPALRWFGSQ